VDRIQPLGSDGRSGTAASRARLGRRSGSPRRGTSESGRARPVCRFGAPDDGGVVPGGGGVLRAGASRTGVDRTSRMGVSRADPGREGTSSERPVRPRRSGVAGGAEDGDFASHDSGSRGSVGARRPPRCGGDWGGCGGRAAGLVPRRGVCGAIRYPRAASYPWPASGVRGGTAVTPADRSVGGLGASVCPDESRCPDESVCPDDPPRWSGLAVCPGWGRCVVCWGAAASGPPGGAACAGAVAAEFRVPVSAARARGPAPGTDARPWS
jgi:hypothetical protein